MSSEPLTRTPKYPHRGLGGSNALGTPGTPQKVGSPQKPETPRTHAMGNRVICATPKRGRAVNNYSLGDRIGKGAFATVYKAIHLQTAEVAAIKQIPLEKIKSVDSIMGEIELLRDLEHPNIVKYFGFMKDDVHLNIVLEYCENGSLAMILHKFGSFPENLVARYMHQVLEGLAYLHRQGTIHRDIKGANILTTKDGLAKLADFGVATRIADGSEPASDRHGVVGTPHWMAPEVIQLHVPTTACDIWSLGSTVVELRTGQPPYGDRPDIGAMYAIVQQDSTNIIPADSSGSLRDFLVLCFEKDPALRVTAPDLLKHPWITKFWENNKLAATAAAYPERTVQEWNSPSRRRRLAVPSMMNLRTSGSSSNGGGSNGRSGSGLKSALKKSIDATAIKRASADHENFEDDFDSLGMFGENPKRVTLADVDRNRPNDIGPKKVVSLKESSLKADLNSVKNAKISSKNKQTPDRKPLAAFVEESSEVYDDDFDSREIETEVAKRMHASSYTVESAGISISSSLADPFSGLEDLMEVSPDEAVLCAQNESSEIMQLVFNNDVDLVIAFKRLSELVVSKPPVRKTIDQLRFLPRVLTTLQGNKKGVSLLQVHPTSSSKIKCQSIYEAFLELVANCIPEQHGNDFLTNFCIAGGLSFVLSHSELAPSRALALVYSMVTASYSSTESEMSIARQLAFREDAVSVVCAFFKATSTKEDLLRASSIILDMFRVCGPRLRANLWYHFNSYGLFHSIVGLLHVDNVLKDDLDNPVSRNFYDLVVSYSRTPQELLSDTVNSKILRKLMRAYIYLPMNSDHRRVILEFFKGVSTLASVLDAMQRGNVASHLIAALRRALHDRRIPEQQSYTTINLLVPTLFNYSRIDRSRQREVAVYGLLPLLQDCVERSPRLREFAFPIFSALAHANHPECWKALWTAKALQSFIDLITETGWQAMAISAISVWMQAKPLQIRPELRPHLDVINKALLTTSGSAFESILSATNSLLDLNRCLCSDIPLAGLFSAIQMYISNANPSASSASMVQALQILLWVISAHHRPASSEFVQCQDEFVSSGLNVAIDSLEVEPSLPVLCSKLIGQIKVLTT